MKYLILILVFTNTFLFSQDSFVNKQVFTYSDGNKGVVVQGNGKVIVNGDEIISKSVSEAIRNLMDYSIDANKFYPVFDTEAFGFTKLSKYHCEKDTINRFYILKEDYVVQDTIFKIENLSYKFIKAEDVGKYLSYYSELFQAWILTNKK